MRIHALKATTSMSPISTTLGVYACRILVPGMSEIYPVDDLEWENNSVANHLREAVLYLPDLDDDECADLLETLNESGLADERLVAALIGLAPGRRYVLERPARRRAENPAGPGHRRRRSDRGRLRMGAPFRADQRRTAAASIVASNAC
jgi:hypothetical protein